MRQDLEMKSEKVLITGCGGMLGSAVYPYFVKRYESVLATDKDVNEEWLVHLDVRDSEKLEQVFSEHHPGLVVHLAAETDLEYCETHADIAEETNAVATRHIAQLCEKYQATLAYVSTAGVFDGEKTERYIESDPPNPLMVYGRTKLQGEQYATDDCSRTFIVRAGWMMGGGREKEKKFIFKILEQLGNGRREVFAVNDRWGTPTYTYDFADNFFKLLQTKKYGLYHMACGGTGTRHDVAHEILTICNRQEIKLTAVDSEFFKEEYFVPRPRSEMMHNHNLELMGLNHMRSWKEALREYIENDFPDYIKSPPNADG